MNIQNGLNSNKIYLSIRLDIILLHWINQITFGYEQKLTFTFI